MLIGLKLHKRKGSISILSSATNSKSNNLSICISAQLLMIYFPLRELFK